MSNDPATTWTEWLKQRLFEIILYVSFVALIVGLYLADYLVIPRIYEWEPLVASILVLCIGFVLYALCWGQLLGRDGYRIGIRRHLASTGLTIYGKYIPGKVWSLLGRSAYVNRHHGIPLGEASMVSFKTQLIFLWTGSFVGLTGMALASGFSTESLAGIAIWLAVTPMLFSQRVADGILGLISKMVKKNSMFRRSAAARSWPCCPVSWARGSSGRWDSI